jgi:acetyl-CoA synthetase
MHQINSFEEYKRQYALSVSNPEKFWAEVAGEYQWNKPWETVLYWNFSEPSIRWFDGATCNMSENCLDRYLLQRSNQTAIIWEPNDPKEQARMLTYKQLHTEVCRFANVLKNVGIKKGDRVCIYLPMIPEAAIAMLACTRLGAIHTVVFAGFSSSSLADRINDCQCSLLITADAFYRGEKKVELKKIADEAMQHTPTIKYCIVYNHRRNAVVMKQGRDLWWGHLAKNASVSNKPEAMESEDPLFILYTSGSTGKPKGVLHTTGGYMVYAGYTFKNVFNYKEGEVFFCTADIGWVTGHSYLIYGPLLNGATTVMFEGTPVYPDHGRFWDVIDKHKVNIFYTAPTAIRSLQAYGNDIFEGKDLSSLRVLGTVGEPINEEAWHWYHKNAGKEKCPIVDTWWQTETGGVLISPVATVTPLKPSFATLPLPGVRPVLLDAAGQEIPGNNVEGNLCIKFPWPGMARTVYGDHERFKHTYFTTYPDYYFTGDGCRRDNDGYYRITGRVDDVINVSGHRIGTGEIEDAIDEHDAIIETAVVGYPHDIKGQGIYAFVICTGDVSDHAKLIAEVKSIVTEKIGAFARPDKIQVVPGLPKTRSGKIMRRILRKIAEGDTGNLGDTTTLLDPSLVEVIRNGAV